MQHGLANVGESGESVQCGLANISESGESDTFPKNNSLVYSAKIKFEGKDPVVVTHHSLTQNNDNGYLEIIISYLHYIFHLLNEYIKNKFFSCPISTSMYLSKVHSLQNCVVSIHFCVTKKIKQFILHGNSSI